MIAVDTSAVIEVGLDQPGAVLCQQILSDADALAMSAGTLAETMVVSRRRGVGTKVERLLSLLDVEIVPVDMAFALLVANAYDRWGKGVHPAALNLGDCFAYALARSRGCPLLFVGDDFARTDVARAG